MDNIARAAVLCALTTACGTAPRAPSGYTRPAVATRPASECAAERAAAATRPMSDTTGGYRAPALSKLMVHDLTWSPQSAQATIDMRISEMGKPIVDSISVTGVPKEAADGLRSWARGLEFRPAVLNDCAVSGRTFMRVGPMVRRQ